MKTKSKQREFFDPACAPYWLTDKTDWQGTPEAVRTFIARRTAEQDRGLAIAKDRRYGRPKYDPDGFYGLQLAKERLAYLERRLPADDAKLVDARAKVERWSADLDEWFAKMQGFEAYAKDRGMTLVQLLEHYWRIEHRMTNPIDGLRYLWGLYGDGRPFETAWYGEILPSLAQQGAHNGAEGLRQ